MEAQKFGERLRELRKAQGMSQRVLAQQAKLDFTYLSKMERNRLEVLPSAGAIHRIAQVLGADESELVNLAGKVPYGLKAMLEENPLLTELVRVLASRRLLDETYRKLLRLAEDEGEQQDTLAYLKQALDEDRLSDRPLFPSERE